MKKLRRNGNLPQVNKYFGDKDVNRVLVVGDLHAPFTLDGYLDHCVNTYRNFNCNAVVFIGDIIDNHYASYHETDPDGLSGGDELTLAVKQIAPWYEAFPNATVIVGNHDRMIQRKAFSSSVPKEWIKPYNEVIGTPGWEWKDRHVIDDVQYIHGEGGTARTRCRADLMSTVQGHLHTQCYTDWVVGAKFKVFGMQVGCGIDFSSYAMAYAKRGKKPAIGCGVIIGGKSALNIMMEL